MDKEFLCIKNCQLGQGCSFTYLYDKYIDEIYKFVYFKTFDVSSAEDITSEVFMKALKSISTFKLEKGANFRAWLYRIANNLVIDSYKSKKETIGIEEYIEEGLELDLGKKIDNKEKLKNIFSFLDTQNPDHKNIVIMRIWEGLSYKDIAVITGKTENNCKKIYSRTIAIINANFTLIIIIFLINI